MVTSYYNNPTPVAVGIIGVGRGFLIVRRTFAPIGGWALPGGFINENENAELAVSREVLEETGLWVPTTSWKPVATRVTPRNQLLIFLKSSYFLTQPELEGFTPNSEATAIKVAYPGEELCFPLHTEILGQAREL